MYKKSQFKLPLLSANIPFSVILFILSKNNFSIKSLNKKECIVHNRGTSERTCSKLRTCSSQTRKILPFSLKNSFYLLMEDNTVSYLYPNLYHIVSQANTILRAEKMYQRLAI